MNEKEIRARLEALVDRWMKATVSERMVLIREKIRLEEQLEQLMAPAKAG